MPNPANIPIPSTDRNFKLINARISICMPNRFPAVLWLVALFVAMSILMACSKGERALQRALNKGSGKVTIPPGVTEISRGLTVPITARNLEVVGSEGSVLRVSPGFQARAVFLIRGGSGIRFRNFTIEGGSAENERPSEAAPERAPLSSHFSGNGISIEDTSDVSIADVQIRYLSAMPILVSRSKKVKLERIRTENCGSRNSKGRANSSGGIVFEEGVEDFEVRGSHFKRILGNGIWIRSIPGSPRNARGLIEGNVFEIVGHHAILISQAGRIQVENNTGRMIGFPSTAVDVENRVIPAVIGSSGKFDEGAYRNNRFEEINGRCFTLDGFHDGEIAGNVCLNRGPETDYPSGHMAVLMNNTSQDMESQFTTIRDNTFEGFNFGGIFVLGKGHKIVRNKLAHLNRVRCREGSSPGVCPASSSEPAMLSAGIYLAFQGARLGPSAENTIEHNEISGFGMKANCVVTSANVEAAANTIRNNKCSGDE